MQFNWLKILCVVLLIVKLPITLLDYVLLIIKLFLIMIKLTKCTKVLSFENFYVQHETVISMRGTHSIRDLLL